MSGKLLPVEILLDAGHLSEVAVSVIADGEEALVPAEVAAHGRSCETCAALVRSAALQSVALGDVMRATVQGPAESLAPVSARATDRAAWIAAAAGLVLSVVGAVAGALGSSLSLGDHIRGLREAGVMLARGFRAALTAELPPVVSFVSAALLVVVAVVVMRTSPLGARSRTSVRPVSS